MASYRKARRRSAHEGSTFRDGNRWRGVATWTDPGGMQHRRYVSAATQAEARVKLDELRRDLGLDQASAAIHNLTVGAFLAEWLERDRSYVRPSTWRSHEQHVRVYLVPTFGRVPLARLKAADVERALASFVANGRPDRPAMRTRGRQNAGGVSKLTARHIRATLRTALSDAIRHELVARNAAAEARPPKVEQRPVVYLNAPQVRKLLEATTEHEHGALFALLVSSGLRLGEALALRWGDIDLDRGILSVRRTLARDDGGKGWRPAEPKTPRSRRTLPLSATARAALLRQRGSQDQAQAAAGTAWRDVDGLVFTDEVGRHLRPEGVSYAFQKTRRAADLPHARLHDLRHSAATLMLAEGVPLAVISAALGHSGVAITMAHYSAVVPELLGDAFGALDRAIGIER